MICCILLAIEDVIESAAAQDPDLRLLRIAMSVVGYVLRPTAVLGLLLVICAVFRTLGGMLFTVGLVSALFGSHGAIRQRMNNRDNSDRQDPEQ